MKYPTSNIFSSAEWKARTASLALVTPAFTIQKLYSLKLAHLRTGLWGDYEEWPSGPVPPIQTCSETDAKADWVVYRKLLAEPGKPDHLKEHGQSLPFFQRPFVTQYSTAPYLDLTTPITHKKNHIADINRTERKLTREIGAPMLREFTTPEECAQWFEWYVEFQRAKNRISPEQHKILKKWILEGQKPGWMQLFALMVKDVAVTVGLFYQFDGVFYYFSSAMTPDLKYRKYGPGKLFVEKLIQHSIKTGSTTFDFLQGAHEYKTDWNPKARVLYQCIYPNSIKGFIALTLFRLKKTLIRIHKKRTERVPSEFMEQPSGTLAAGRA